MAGSTKSRGMKKLSKPLAIGLCALFIVGMVSVLAVQPAQAATTLALHTSGSNILDADGNVVYLRGVGVAGFAPDLILWGSGATDNFGVQWNYNPTAAMDQTFSAMQSQWHINMIRVFVYPSWYYRDNIVPAQEDSNYASSTTPISTKAYLQTLCNEAAKYGIYVNIVPYMLTPYSGSFGNDPYVTSSFAGAQGLPMCGWDSAGQRFLSDAGYGGNELGFWNWFWSDMAQTLMNCPNAIFEAWNEPQPGADNAPITSGYLQYLQTMYSAIRGTGSTNLIMMQWHMGWFPNGYGNDLSWCKQIATAIPTATNLVYTTHLYYHAPTDLSSYWNTDYAGLKSQLQAGVATMGVTAPLVINEEGSCLGVASNKQNDITWWRNVVLAQRDLGIGAGAYYWLSDAGLGPVYAGETILSSGYSPNAMGQAYIDAYNGPATTPTQEPTVTPTPQPTTEPTATPTSEPTATPTPAPTETPTPTPTETTPSSTTDPQTLAPTQDPTPDPTTEPTKPPATQQPTKPAFPTNGQTWTQYKFHHYWSPWHFFFWGRFNGWFFCIHR